MKRLCLLSALAAAPFLLSCGSHSAAETAAENPAQTTASTTTAAPAPGVAAGLDKMDELRKLEPYPDDKMKQLLPTEVGGLQHTAPELMKVIGKLVSATYEQTPGTGFRVAITDCAGEQGAGKYMLAYEVPMAAEDSPAPTPETQNLTTQKKVELAGQPALSRHDPVNDVYSIVFMNQQRLFVDVTGPAGTSLADVVGFATKLNASL